MKGVPRDIDEMMWVIADRPTDEALNDFEVRFPEFRGELGRRLAMVRSLRAGNPNAPIPVAPKFRAPAAPSVRPIWPYAAAAVALAALGFAATRSAFTSAPEKPKPVVVSQGDAQLPPGSQSPDSIRPVPVDNGTNPNPEVPSQKLPKPVPTYKTLNVNLKGAPLGVALEAIAAQAGIQLEVGPGLESIVVDVQYSGLTAPQMFENLGAEHGFTALEQEFGKFLIVPARPN